MRKQYAIDLQHIELLVLNMVLDNQVEFATVGQGVASPADEILRGFQIQFQRQRQRNCRGFGRLVIWVVTNLGEMLLGQQRFLVNFRILFSCPVNQFQQSFRKTCVSSNTIRSSAFLFRWRRIRQRSSGTTP